jgi:protein SCO1/2
MNHATLKAMAFVFVFLGGVTVYSAWRYSVRNPPPGSEQKPSALVDHPDGYDADILARWTLGNARGGDMKSEDLTGKVHIVSFFFATCPGTCNLQNTHLKGIAQKYGPKGVQFLSITTDPKVDTRELLADYAIRFEANKAHWHFLRHDDVLYLRRIGADFYAVPVDEKVHMDRFVLVDKWGNRRLFCDWKSDASRSELYRKMDELLAEEEPPEHLVDPAATPPRRPAGYEDELEEQAEELSKG